MKIDGFPPSRQLGGLGRHRGTVCPVPCRRPLKLNQIGFQSHESFRKKLHGHTSKFPFNPGASVMKKVFFSFSKFLNRNLVIVTLKRGRVTDSGKAIHRMQVGLVSIHVQTGRPRRSDSPRFVWPSQNRSSSDPRRRTNSWSAAISFQ